MADTSRTLEALKSLSEAQAKIVDARNEVIGAVEDRSILLAKIEKLEELLAASDDWKTEKQRYELRAAASGAFFYSLRADAQPNEQPHSICARCYQNGRKSILQQIAAGMGKQEPGYGAMHQCPECLFEVVV